MTMTTLSFSRRGGRGHDHPYVFPKREGVWGHDHPYLFPEEGGGDGLGPRPRGRGHPCSTTPYAIRNCHFPYHFACPMGHLRRRSGHDGDEKDDDYDDTGNDDDDDGGGDVDDDGDDDDDCDDDYDDGLGPGPRGKATHVQPHPIRYEIANSRIISHVQWVT